MNNKISRLANYNIITWGLTSVIFSIVYLTLNIVSLITYPILYLFVRNESVMNKTTVQKNIPSWLSIFGNPEDGVYWDWEVLNKYKMKDKKHNFMNSFTWNVLRNPCYGYLYMFGEYTIEISSIKTIPYGARSEVVVFKMKEGRNRYFIDLKENIPLTNKRFDFYVGLKPHGIITIDQFISSDEVFNMANKTNNTKDYYSNKYESKDFIYRKGYEIIPSGIALRIKDQ